MVKIPGRNKTRCKALIVRMSPQEAQAAARVARHYKRTVSACVRGWFEAAALGIRPRRRRA